MGWIPIDVEMEMLHQIPNPNAEVEKFPVMNFSVGVGLCALTNRDLEKKNVFEGFQGFAVIFSLWKNHEKPAVFSFDTVAEGIVVLEILHSQVPKMFSVF